MIGWLSVGIAAYGVMVLVLYAAQRGLIYFPSTMTPGPPATGVTEVQYRTDDGLDLSGWYAPSSACRATIVYFQGNAGHYGDRLPKVGFLLNEGYGVLLVGYRGYGGNAGRPSETGLYADGRAAIAWLTAQVDPAERIVLYGESLGSGVASMMAAENDVSAVVLEAPFTSVTDVARTRFPIFPVDLLLRDRFDSLSRIADVDAPLLVIHGRRDGTVPFRFGQRLFDAAHHPKRATWFDDAGHNDLYEFGAAEPVLAFLADLPAQNADGECTELEP